MPATESPTDLAHADVGLVCALSMELSEFLSRCERVRQYKGADFVFRGGRYDQARVAVVESGVGFALARRATEALIDGHTPAWVISAGFCGALRPQLGLGDIVMANAVVDLHGHEVRVDLRMGDEPRKGLHIGRLLTADAVVRTVAEKRELAERHDAIAVDLESLAVAQVCGERKVPFLAVRVVSDDLSHDLPPEVLTVMGRTGTYRVGAALSALWRRPGSAKDMWQLRTSAGAAAARLATFLDGVVLQLARSSQRP